MSIKHRFIFIVALFFITAVNPTAWAMEEHSELGSIEELNVAEFYEPTQEQISFLQETLKESNFAGEDIHDYCFLQAEETLIKKIGSINKYFFNTTRAVLIASLEYNYIHNLLYAQHPNYPLIISNILLMPFLMWTATDSNSSLSKFFATPAMLVLNPDNIVFNSFSLLFG